MTDRPMRRDYARIERERRFVLDALPAHVERNGFVRLRDTFVDGAGLRVRRVEAPDGTELVTKLGHKRADPDAPDDPTRRLLTTIYLEPGQADALAALPGRRSCKRRYTVRHGSHSYAVDVWEQPAARRGLVLAEVECEHDDELRALTPPPWIATEVTDDPAFSAFELAAANDTDAS